MRKKITVFISLLALAVTLPLSAQKISDFLKGKKKEHRYSVTIKSRPHADVYLNGESKGTTDISLTLKKGRYDLKLVPKNRKKYKELNTQINISSDQTFQFQLEKKKRGFFRR
ncbi:MAG: hypothetical protein CVV50_00225 [Spirochaetae bacterium HGW-Spirochaetae-6]|jgi:hypothetical protein|nr:MAG: hypothetical protein CVV50_00225 [Spirochaetae bacterium HGW-Spirochaetae-6]